MPARPTIIVEWVQPPVPLANRLREWIRMSMGQVGSDFQAEVAAAAEATDVRAELQALARSYITAVVKPDVLRRRQLVLREAGRFPDMARKYHDSGPRRTIGALATAFARLTERGELAIDDPQVAATQFAFLVIGEPLDTAMFRGVGRGRSRRDLNALADAGVEVFIAAYGTKLSSATR
jgi:TetR/AcrR family transcriptional regulator, mexJK operon transcriptional repressor